MDRRYLNYSRRKFNNWRNKVAAHLPFFVTEFYKIESYIDYDMHKMLGRVIMEINNPSYSILDCYGKRLDRNSEMAAEIFLELDVNHLFGFIAKFSKSR